MMYKLFVQGVVQGVGFRPYIYRKAIEYNLVGTVKNTGNGVEIIINDKEFIKKITDLPPLAEITQHSITPYTGKQKFVDFTIQKSTTSSGETILPADIFMCNDCLHELQDSHNRRFEYYFITCTNCGPRFSMIEDYPYDRPLTSMKHFPMCPVCKQEYTDPFDRRYHAQTIACKNCGPKLRFFHKTKELTGRTDKETIGQAADQIAKGSAVAIKGVGGFHLCSRTSDESVLAVRKLLHRPYKPFAIMVRDIEMATSIGRFSAVEKELVSSPQRPIVVVKKQHPDDLFSVSELDSIGIILPYTALHYLLFDVLNEPLLMTSCNVPGEPVAITEKIAQYYLTHDREIVNRCDDSVLKVITGKTVYLRRSRGYTPLPVLLPLECKDTIAVGAELNNVVCTVKKNRCFLSQYIGQTSKVETQQFLRETVETFVKLTRLQPTIIACDAHPTYFSTQYAKELSEIYNASLVQIQHHKAHVASVAAEHGLTDYIGIAIDGLGYGDDGTIWGGEVFSVKNKTDFTRDGHLEVHPQIGGDYATIYPKRMLFGILSKILDEKELRKTRMFDEKEIPVFLSMIDKGFNVPLTSSTGRVLDAASALLGLCDKRYYDGRPAMLLESFSSKPYDFEPILKHKKGKTILLTTPLFEYLLDKKDKDKKRLAATVQMYLAKGLLAIAQEKQSNEKIPIVVSGGVSYNSMIVAYLLKHGVLMNKEIPCGDGCICYGQAYLANVLEKEKEKQ